MFKKILIILSLFSVSSFLFSVTYAQESVTITTYYPSPYGVYRVMRIYPSNAGTPTNPCTNPGEMYYDNATNALYVCSGSPATWTQLGGGGPGAGFWVDAGGNQIRNTNTGRVIVGTNAGFNVGEKMEVNSHLVVRDGSLSLCRASGMGVISCSTSNVPMIFLAGPAPGVSVTGSATNSNRFYRNANDAYLAISGSLSPNPLIVFKDNGNIGIGTTSPQAKLDVNGNIGFTGQKVCSVFLPGNWRDSIIVPSSWTNANCRDLLNYEMADTNGRYQLGCINSNGVSFGTWGGYSSANAGAPSPNCGW